MKDEFCLDLLMHHKVHISWKNDLSFPSSHHKDFHFRLTRQDFSKLMKEMKTNKTLLAFWLLRTRSVIKTTRSKICCKLSTQNSNINDVIVKNTSIFYPLQKLSILLKHPQRPHKIKEGQWIDSYWPLSWIFAISCISCALGFSTNSHKLMTFAVRYCGKERF